MFLHWWVLIVAAALFTAFSIIYILEWRHPRYMMPHIHHSWKSWFMGSAYIAGNVFVSWLMASYLVFASTYVTGLLSYFTANIWLQFILSFLIIDILMYWWHRINHLVPMLWKYHEMHHEDKELNILSAFNFHPKEIGISTIWKIIIFPLLGIHPAALIIYDAVFLAVILFHHSNFKLNFLPDKFSGKLIITPGQHHIHHSVKLQESNSNYGSVFSLWDRIFRSHTVYTQQPVIYGVIKNKATL